MPAQMLQIKVKPQSRVSSLTQQDDGTWLAQVKSPPVDGKANEELIALVATQMGCRKADVSVKRGASGRMKLVKIDA
jgi:uncharacterized protein (TIGR00251 family)